MSTTTLKELLGVSKTVSRSKLLARGFSDNQLDKLLTQLDPSHSLFVQRQEGEMFYRLESNVGPGVLMPKIWQVARCPDPKKPYLWIQFPDNNWKKIMVVPLSDLQWGAEECREEAIRSYIKWIGETENVFAFINGDLLNNALAGSVGGSVYFDKIKPHEQVLTMIELLRPIAHKILWAIPGNHEERTVKVADLDPLEWICMALNIPYYSQPIFVDILWNDHRFSFYCFHGVSGSRTMGGKLNAASKPMEWTEFIMFYVMGHVHEPMGNPVTRRCIVRTYGKNGKLKELKVIDRDQYVIIAAAWLNFWDSYAHKAAYAPPPQGSPIAYLLANGGYEMSQ